MSQPKKPKEHPLSGTLVIEPQPAPKSYPLESSEEMHSRG
jgi:hypothetical protein